MLYKVSHSHVSVSRRKLLTGIYLIACINIQLFFPCFSMCVTVSIVIHNHNRQTAFSITGDWTGVWWEWRALGRDLINQLLFLLWGRSRTSIHFCPLMPISHPPFFTSSYWSPCIDLIWVMKWWFCKFRGWPRISTYSSWDLFLLNVLAAEAEM